MTAAQAGSDWSLLMAASQNGDAKAYRQLLGEITPYLRQIARRRLRNASDIEDAVQDVLLTLHNVRQTYDPSRPFAPWLATIADRRVLDAGRKLSRRGGREDPLDDGHETLATTPANHYPEGLLARDVARALEGLPEGQRRAVDLVNVQGLDLVEAARISGQSVGSLKVSVHRALKSLRGKLQDDK